MRLTLSFVFVLFTATLFAQQISSRFTSRDRGWVTFGIDGGWAYQSSDVRTTFDGWGAGMTLSKNLTYRPGGLLSFDIRSRLLFTRAYGSDWRPTFNIRDNDALNGTNRSGINYLIDTQAPNDSAFVFANHRTGMGELDIEGVWTFNRLRERTGIVFNVFGGIGLNLYRTRLDQGNSNNSAYDYLSIDRTNGKRNTISELTVLRDGRYESRADGFGSSGIRAGFMPDAGVELGYQLTRNFVIGVGHKTTFSRTDLLDGQRWEDNGIAKNDWSHYTNIFMRWDLGRRVTRSRNPVIDITDPNDNPHIAQGSSVFVRANIRNVNSPADVRCYINGESRGFEFRNGRFGSNVLLRPGRNEFVIEASNPSGHDSETLVIVWERNDPRLPTPPPPPSDPAPVVRITSPSSSPYKTDRPDIYLRAEVQNVREKRDLKLLVNGIEETRFTLAEGLEASLRLREGRNTIRVEASTPAGRSSDEVVVEVGSSSPPPPPPPPSSGRKPNVNITQPSAATASTNEKVYDFQATVTNVDSRDNITLLLNNREIRDFEYTPRSGALNARLDLQPNDNTVVVRAQNSAGKAEDNATITRRNVITPPPPPPPVKKPLVSIIQPANGSMADQKTVAFKANTQNVNGKNEVVVVLNGANMNVFDFDVRNQVASGNLNLRDGENVLTIKVTNAAGSADATVRFQYAPATPKPVVDIISPDNNSEIRTSDADFRAKVDHVSSKNDILIYVNGKTVPNFEFNNRTGQVSATIQLGEGENTVRITASNTSGTGEKSHKVRYTPQIQRKPSVSISAPADRSRVDNPQASLIAKTTNVFSDRNISVQLNGTNINAFNFDRSGNLAASLTLKEGENIISVIAATPEGKAEASVTVVYVPKADKPVVTFLQPSGKNPKTDKETYAAKAKVTGVAGTTDIKVFLNNVQLRKFDFNGRTNEVTFTVTLKEGKNTLRVSAQNRGGSAQAEADITYQKSGPVPTVKFVSVSQPATDPFNPNVAKTSIIAKLTNVTNKSEITMTMNGRAITDFQFNAATGDLVGTGDLKKGENIILIKAVTTNGSAEASYKINW